MMMMMMKFSVVVVVVMTIGVFLFQEQQQHQHTFIVESFQATTITSTSRTKTSTTRTSRWSTPRRKSTSPSRPSSNISKPLSWTRRRRRTSSVNKNDSGGDSIGLVDRVTNSGIASAAAMATAAVNAAVSMKTLEPPSVGEEGGGAGGGGASSSGAQKSYVSKDTVRIVEQPNGGSSTSNTLIDDETGLPLVYDKDLINAYWTNERDALSGRWNEFVRKAIPFLTKLMTLYIRDGTIIESEIPALAKRAVSDMEELGPTFIKLGQMMSVRPDVLPQSALQELQTLQDNVIPFDTTIAIQQIERELNASLGTYFTSISEEPVAAASLAQVYKATLNDGYNTVVAIKVQRPSVLGIISKDLYVLRRAAEVMNGLVERFIPQQRTDYVALLNEWSIGFYTELDFINEMNNQIRLRNILHNNNNNNNTINLDVMVPKVYEDLCTRRILVSEWVDGIKLSQCTTEQIRDVIPAAQEAFLVQLFTEGFMHADPHAGNILMLNNNDDDDDNNNDSTTTTTTNKNKPKIALIDCGLMANINQDDRNHFISSVIHLANKDYKSLVDDFIQLEILPTDTNRDIVIPLMDKALSPYIKGGGAKRYEQEIRKIYDMTDTSDMKQQMGGFQAMTSDALTVLEDVPFRIPPSFALLGRAIVTLEGIALSGNPNYGIIMESYPFIARKLLQENDQPEIQKALLEVLYNTNDNSSNEGGGGSSSLKLTRLLSLLNNAAGNNRRRGGGIGSSNDGNAFVDLDALPTDGTAISIGDGLKFVLSDQAIGLRTLLEDEVDNIVDVLFRRYFRRTIDEMISTMKTTTRTPLSLLPRLPTNLPFIGGDVFSSSSSSLPSFLPRPPAIEEIKLPLLLPTSSATTTAGASIALLTINEFTNYVAPKLNQDEELYALGLVDGISELLLLSATATTTGDAVDESTNDDKKNNSDDDASLLLLSELLKGNERILSPSSFDLMLSVIRSSGILTTLGANSNDDDDDDNEQQKQQQARVVGEVFKFIDTLSKLIINTPQQQQQQQRGNSSNKSKSRLENEVSNALNGLNINERKRFDSIMNEIISRMIQRTIQRLQQNVKQQQRIF